MFRQIGYVFSFLTIFPSSGTTLENTARYMYLFPIIGIIIGLFVGSIGFGLSELIEYPILVGLLVAASFVIVTGIHHTDGLADFADGIMVKGNKEQKLKAMKDVFTGSAGTVGLVLYIIGLVATVSLTSGFDLFRAILISEILAKFSMVLITGLGNSAALGSNVYFIQAMKDKRKLAIAFVLMIIPVVLVGQAMGLVMLAVTITLALFLLVLSTRSFGGITGDTIGATNELSRLASLMVFVIL